MALVKGMAPTLLAALNEGSSLQDWFWEFLLSFSSFSLRQE